jgi:hypothetical protein
MATCLAACTSRRDTFLLSSEHVGFTVPVDLNWIRGMTASFAAMQSVMKSSIVCVPKGKIAPPMEKLLEIRAVTPLASYWAFDPAHSG